MNVISRLKDQSNTDIFREQGIKYLGLFGSYARNEAKKDSDIDLLVDFRQTKSLFELADIVLFLRKILGKEVDLVDRKTLKRDFAPYIMQDLITVYEER